MRQFLAQKKYDEDEGETPWWLEPISDQEADQEGEEEDEVHTVAGSSISELDEDRDPLRRWKIEDQEEDHLTGVTI